MAGSGIIGCSAQPDAAVEVVESQGGEFGAARAGVRDQPGEQLELLGAVPSSSLVAAEWRSGVQLVGLLLGADQEVLDLVDRDVLAAVALGWSLDAVERMRSRIRMV